MESERLSELRDRVQYNCHISDARHGSEYGLCTYLMKMREFFRWEMGLGFADTLAQSEVGDWLSDRESLWAELGESEFQPLAIDGREFDPFDARSINQALADHGLVYSGGLGYAGRPHFFLGELEHQGQRNGFSLLVSGRELARDLTAPPAMTRDDVIFVRRESLRRMLWEKLESWRWNRPQNALGRAFSCYDFERDLDGSLELMTDSELELVLLHEEGECGAGAWLGTQWNEMLRELEHTPAELGARAVRDHLADCMVTLPSLLDMGRPSSIHFYIGNLTPMRRELFPRLRWAYDQWLESGNPETIRDTSEQGRDHWQSVAREMLALHSRHGSEAAAPIRELMEQSKL